MSNEPIYNFTIRLANEADIPAVAEITKDAFTKYVELAGISGKLDALNESYEDIKKDIESKHVFVAFIDNIPVGSVRVEILPDNTAYLSRFGVSIKNQNSGIGKALMNAVDKVMTENSVKQLKLHTASKYLSLMGFYYARGFYVDSITTDRGYIRASMTKEY